MNTETLTKETQVQIWAIEALAQVFYFLHVDTETLPIIYRKLPQSPLKDFCIHFTENQMNWKRKGLRAMDNIMVNGVKIKEALLKDMESGDLWAMMDCINDLKAGQDMESISAILKELVEVKDLTPIKQSLILQIQNLKYKEQV